MQIFNMSPYGLEIWMEAVAVVAWGEDSHCFCAKLSQEHRFPWLACLFESRDSEHVALLVHTAQNKHAASAKSARREKQQREYLREHRRAEETPKRAGLQTHAHVVIGPPHER